MIDRNVATWVIPGLYALGYGLMFWGSELVHRHGSEEARSLTGGAWRVTQGIVCLLWPVVAVWAIPSVVWGLITAPVRLVRFVVTSYNSYWFMQGFDTARTLHDAGVLPGDWDKEGDDE